jgi:hypothetical protein
MTPPSSLFNANFYLSQFYQVVIHRAMVAEWSKRTMFTQVLDHSLDPWE